MSAKTYQKEGEGTIISRHFSAGNCIFGLIFLFSVLFLPSLSLAADYNETCREINGTICHDDMNCSIGFVNSTDSEMCCLADCYEECYDNQTRKCGNETGECRAGIQTCTDEKWGPCLGEIMPVKETCNQKDDDCNGIIDDVTRGRCQCYGGAVPADEICDGIDNNCNEQTDENGCLCTQQNGHNCTKFDTCQGISLHATDTLYCCSEPCISPCAHGETRECGSDIGICTIGIQICRNGEWDGCNASTKAKDEVCNGLDDDCNGIIDDLYMGKSKIDTGCGCYGGAIPSEEICDNIDNDCDGKTDEECRDIAEEDDEALKNITGTETENNEDVQEPCHIDELVDSDCDSMSDTWEKKYRGLDIYKDDSGDDPDNDGRTNKEEYIDNTDPFTAEDKNEGSDLFMIIIIAAGIISVAALGFGIFAYSKEPDIVKDFIKHLGYSSKSTKNPASFPQNGTHDAKTEEEYRRKLEEYRLKDEMTRRGAAWQRQQVSTSNPQRMQITKGSNGQDCRNTEDAYLAMIIKARMEKSAASKHIENMKNSNTEKAKEKIKNRMAKDLSKINKEF